jgi:cytochrome c-type biogenesis protein CcmH
MRNARSNGSRRFPVQVATWMLVAAAAFGCDRAVEPYVPGEKPEQPDLSRIFPEGAERAAEKGGEARPGMPAAQGAPTDRGGAPVAGAAGAPLRGTITLAPDFERKVPAGAILFLIARKGEGGGPPLAVKRVESPTFPMDFTIGPDDRMIEAMPFEGPLQLSARLDADGNAMTRAAGDLQGQSSAPHQPGATGVAIVIDQVL